MPLIRGIVPWKRDIEHSMEEAIHYVTNVADSDLVVETLDRVRFPQRMSVVQGDELLPVNIAGSSYWHGGKERVLVGVAFWRIGRIRMWSGLITRLQGRHLLL